MCVCVCVCVVLSCTGLDSNSSVCLSVVNASLFSPICCCWVSSLEYRANISICGSHSYFNQLLSFPQHCTYITLSQLTIIDTTLHTHTHTSYLVVLVLILNSIYPCLSLIYLFALPVYFYLLICIFSFYST